MKFDKSMLLLYAITDRKPGDDLYAQVSQALKGGVTIVQLREKDMDFDAFVCEARQIAVLCHSYGVPLIINDNLEVALLSGADGVHVGADDLPVAEIRRRAGRDFIIGATAKTTERAKEAEKSGADYLGVGAMFPSPTKKNAVRITNEQLKEIASSASIPIVAIGGISLENCGSLAGSGVDGIAVVSAIFSADNIKETTAALKKKATEIIE